MLTAAYGVLSAHPWVAAVVGAALLALGRRPGRRMASAAGWAWVAYALYETGMLLRLLCTGECNIRIDLLVIYPALAVLTLIGLLSR